MADSDMDSEESREDDREELKLQLEFLDSVHQRNVFLPSRTIFLGSEAASLEGETGTDSKMAEYFMKNMHVLESLSLDPITVIANNVGGDMYHGLAIYDSVKNSSCKINMCVRGQAMSMGSIILQAAHERVMSPNSIQMIHYGYSGCDGHSKTFLKWAKEEERLISWMESIYLARIREKRPDFSIEDLRKLLDHDTFLTAQASVDLGLADRIG